MLLSQFSNYERERDGKKKIWVFILKTGTAVELHNKVLPVSMEMESN